MSDPAQEKQLGGLARSIGALFSEPDTPDAAVPDAAAEVRDLLDEVEGAEPGDDLPRRVVAALGAERDDGRRAALIGACVRLGPAAAEELADALSEGDDRGGRRAYLAALVAMGPTSRPVVATMMEDDRWYVLRNGLAILGEIGGEDAMGAIVRALARPEAKVRREALIALAKIGGDDAGQLALGMLEDPDAAVRTAAARAAGDLGVQRAHRRLVQMLGTEDDPDLVVAVLRALGQLGDPGAVLAIERHAVGSFLRKPPPEVRITAYRALRQIGTPHARRLLNQAVDDRDQVVKQAVRQLLGMT